MKTITFSDPKRPLITFEASELAYDPQGVDDASGLPVFVISAEGVVVFQETIAVEEMVAGDYPCFMTVTENGAELMNSKCNATFLTFEPDHFVARIMIGIS